MLCFSKPILDSSFRLPTTIALLAVGLACFHGRLCADDASESAAAVSRLTADLTYLASDELAGRGVGSQGIAQAGEFIANRFKELGLQTDAFDGTPFQPFGIPGAIGMGEPARNTLQLPYADKPSTDWHWARISIRCHWAAVLSSLAS